MQKHYRSEPRSTTKSGVMPRPVIEPEGRREPPPPPTLPEFKEEGSTTGSIPIYSEGHDSSAIGDADRANGN